MIERLTSALLSSARRSFLHCSRLSDQAYHPQKPPIATGRITRNYNKRTIVFFQSGPVLRRIHGSTILPHGPKFHSLLLKFWQNNSMLPTPPLHPGSVVVASRACKEYPMQPITDDTFKTHSHQTTPSQSP